MVAVRFRDNLKWFPLDVHSWCLSWLYSCGHPHVGRFPEELPYWFSAYKKFAGTGCKPDSSLIGSVFWNACSRQRVLENFLTRRNKRNKIRTEPGHSVKSARPLPRGLVAANCSTWKVGCTMYTVHRLYFSAGYCCCWLKWWFGGWLLSAGCSLWWSPRWCWIAVLVFRLYKLVNSLGPKVDEKCPCRNFNLKFDNHPSYRRCRSCYTCPGLDWATFELGRRMREVPCNFKSNFNLEDTELEVMINHHCDPNSESVFLDAGCLFEV